MIVNVCLVLFWILYDVLFVYLLELLTGHRPTTRESLLGVDEDSGEDTECDTKAENDCVSYGLRKRRLDSEETVLAVTFRADGKSSW